MIQGLDRRDYVARGARTAGIGARSDARRNPHATAELIREGLGGPKGPIGATGTQAQIGKPAGIRSQQRVRREAGPQTPLQALMPQAFIVSLRLMVHQGITQLQQSLDILVGRAPFVEPLSVH